MMNEQQELLITRVAEGTAGPADWDALFAAGREDDALWRRIAESQRDQAQLEALMTRVDAVADRVSVPDAADAAASARQPRSWSGDIVRGSVRGHWGGWRAWTGWAVAAALIVAWNLAPAFRRERTVSPPSDRAPERLARISPNQGPNAAPSPSPAVPVTPVSTQQAFQDYLAKGQADGSVLGVVPRRMIMETRPNPSGRGYEIIYLQQIMERTVVPDLYQLEGLDERGRPGLVRFEDPPRSEM